MRYYVKIKKEINAVLEKMASTALTLGFDEIACACEEGCKRLTSPLRIGIIGITKAGKSTLINAIIGKRFLPTNALVCTYNVNVLRHKTRSPIGEECVIIHLNDGNKKVMSLMDFSALVDQTETKFAKLRTEIEWVEVFIDSDVLIEADLIDSPGLNSANGIDAQNTERFLAGHINELQPDVVLFLVQKEFTEEDLNIVQRFQQTYSREDAGNELIGNSITCFRSDPSPFDDVDNSTPSARMNVINNKKKLYPKFDTCFANAYYVAPLHALAAYLMTEEDFIKMQSICHDVIAYKKLKRRNDDHFLNQESWDALSIEEKEMWLKIIGNRNEVIKFVQKFGVAAIQRCCWWIEKNQSGTLNEVKRYLLEYSNLKDVEQYVFGCFRSFSVFFKYIKCIIDIRRLISEARKHSNPNMQEYLNKMDIMCKRIADYLYNSFAYLSVIREAYKGITRDAYFTDLEWNRVIETVRLCYSDLIVDKEQLYDEMEHWASTKKYYNLIYNYDAEVAAKSLILLIKQRLWDYENG